MKELKFKLIKNIPTNELSAFVNTIYDNFFHEIANLQDLLKNENDPLHYLIIKMRLEEAQNALHMVEAVVDEATEFQEMGEEPENLPDQYPEYKVGEAVLYQNGDRFELGIIKTICDNNEYFVWYHTGDTAARTHARNLHKISNEYTFHIIRLDPEDKERR